MPSSPSGGTLFLALLFLWPPAPSLSAESVPLPSAPPASFALPPAVPAPADPLDEALDAFYRGDWQAARRLFDQAAQARPEDPRPVFLSSMIPFWDYFFVSQSSGSAQSYLELSDRAVAMSERLLERDPADSTAVLLLSGLHGYRSLVAAGERMHVKALRSGITGFGYTRRLLEMGEERADVRIGRGMYHYMVGSIPPEMHWALRLFRMEPGSVEQGFRELEAAACDTTHLGTEARMILAYLHRKEGNLPEALRHLDALLVAYPANPIFHYLRGDVLERDGQLDPAREAYALVLSLDNPSMAPLRDRSRERLLGASPAAALVR